MAYRDQSTVKGQEAVNLLGKFTRGLMIYGKRRGIIKINSEFSGCCGGRGLSYVAGGGAEYQGIWAFGKGEGC